MSANTEMPENVNSEEHWIDEAIKNLIAERDKLLFKSSSGLANPYFSELEGAIKRLTATRDEMLSSKETTEAHIKAVRYNEGKIDWTLIDYPSLVPMIKVLEFGAKKYSRDGWKLPMDKLTILGSLQRHLSAAHSGEEIDPESGLPHMAHIMVNCMIYIFHYAQDHTK